MISRTVKAGWAVVKPLSPLQKIALALITVAALMLPWVFYLGATLRGQTHVRMWSSTWVGLDSMEIIGLVVTAWATAKKRTLVIIAATVTGTMFLLDAWFDVMTSQSGAAWYEALFTAVVGELPMALGCFLIALTAPAWVRDGETATARTAGRLARLRAVVEFLRRRVRA